MQREHHFSSPQQTTTHPTPLSPTGSCLNEHISESWNSRSSLPKPSITTRNNYSASSGSAKLQD